jgi:hypothetical protein
MKNYVPLPGDIIALYDRSLTVHRVFPTQVIIQFGPNDEQALNTLDFDETAAKTFAMGATLTRDGVQLWPTTEETPPAPAPEHLSGSHNTHARLSPSDSKRWTNCTASIAFEEANKHRIAKDGSFESNEGTEAHDWATKLLRKTAARPDILFNPDIPDLTKLLRGEITPQDIPEKFRAPVLTYTQYCDAAVPGATLTHIADLLSDAELGFDIPDLVKFVEEEIPLYYQPEQNGTADFIAIEAEGGQVKRIYVNDYKHGAGVLVTTQENTQLAIYAYSVLKRLEAAYTFADDTEVHIAIVQPRHHEAGDPTPWVITVADLRTFCEDIEYRAIQARTAADRVRERITTTGENVSNDAIREAAPGALFAPSEGDAGACRWCKCKAFCAVRLAAAVEDMALPLMAAEDMLEYMPDLDKKLEPEARIAQNDEILGGQGRIIGDEYLAVVVARAKAIRTFLSDVEEYLEARLLAGEEIKGVKLVVGREGNREWVDETDAETFLKGQGLKQEERFDFKLKSPAKVETLLKQKLKTNKRTNARFEQLITRSAAKKKLAVDADRRDSVPAAINIMPVIEEDFEV